MSKCKYNIEIWLSFKATNETKDQPSKIIMTSDPIFFYSVVKIGKLQNLTDGQLVNKLKEIISNYLIPNKKHMK